MKETGMTTARTGILLLSLLLVVTISACRSLAQDSSGTESASGSGSATVSGSENSFPQTAGANTDVSGVRAAARTALTGPTPGGIPTDLSGIAGAMGRLFTAAFIVASVIGVWSVIERLVVLRRRRVIPDSFVDRFLTQLRAGRIDKSEALGLCQQNASPVSDIFMHGIRKWGRPSAEVEQAVMDGGQRQVYQLRKGLRVLNGVSTLSPLIGLLGTVVGMIRSFNDIAVAGAMGQTQTLANGIALALLTTAAGLMIAIPAMAAYLYLAGRIDAIVSEMDRLGLEVVHLISAEALRDRVVVTPSAPEPNILSRQRKPAVEM